MKGTITKVSGPVVHAKIKGAINDLVRVGDEHLLGEIIEIRDDQAIIQVYEDTTGLSPGGEVINTQSPLQVMLAPGILGQVYDGTQRPLNTLFEKEGIYIKRGSEAQGIDTTKKWDFKPIRKKGQEVKSGDVLGVVQENELIEHKILVPYGVEGKIEQIHSGKKTVEETIAVINGIEVKMLQYWPVRKPRPINKRLRTNTPLLSGQRVIDFLFPISKGGVAAIPGPFGCGKTVTQQQFAKWCDADIIVYIGCGERGNEMTDVLEEFPHLIDPKSGKPLMNRTILIANTSNMPVAAREASVYTGITIAEYFRDQGYDVALMADSTSRWAEAMREISGRLEEMPGEEGYPAYLSKRLAEFYERAGRVETLSGDEASVSIIGAVSPPGGDFSEPVTQNTLRLAKCFWALDSKLADKRHYPAIDWLSSYSLYTNNLTLWFNDNISEEWNYLRKKTQKILQEEKELLDIAQLVGVDALPKEQQILLFIAKMIREDFLQQNAFHEEDTYCPIQKQYYIIKNIIHIGDKLLKTAEQLDPNKLRTSKLSEFIGQLKYVPNKEFENTKKLDQKIKTYLKKMLEEKDE